jgi:HSP20 family molecular chaperone IbpA
VLFGREPLATAPKSETEEFTQKESVKMKNFQMKVAPDTVAYGDAETHKLVVEFAIPGAPSDSIDVKILEDSVHLTAPARDIEYVAALALGWPVKPDKAEATYENGLLRIEVPFKDPMEDAVKVAIKTSGAETKPKTIATGGELPAAARVGGKVPAGQQPKSPVAAPA